jgi:DNA polymerase
MTTLNLDYETFSDVDLFNLGLDHYTASPRTEVLMAAYSFDGGAGQIWSADQGGFPAELREALEDPHVEKLAWNAQFERVVSQRVLRTRFDPLNPAANWRCTMFRAYSLSYVGTLDEVGSQMGLPDAAVKSSRGKALIRMFSQPRKPTIADPRPRYDWRTHPAEWEEFRQYCAQDVVAERAILAECEKVPFPKREWELYEIDQIINDRGIPISVNFADQCYGLFKARQDELKEEINARTGLINSLSGAQFLPWARERKYPFNDLQADTVDKVLDADNQYRAHLDGELAETLRLRRLANRTAPSKNKKVIDTQRGGRMRYTLQIAGASRTGRWGGRRLNPQNMKRTPKAYEHPAVLQGVTNAIESGDLDWLRMFADEPMNPLADMGRSVIQAPEGYEFTVADLSSIETAVIGWLCGCRRLLKVFSDRRDPYKDFGQILFNVEYDQVTKKQRNNAKPGVLGGGFRLGGGGLNWEGKKTGMWGYAENMGVQFTQEEAKKAVDTFRATYPEIPIAWKAIEFAAKSAMRDKGASYSPIINRTDGSKHTMPVHFVREQGFLRLVLPSGRAIHYKSPQIEVKTVTMPPSKKDPEGYTFEAEGISYMGKPQEGPRWARLSAHGGVFIENMVQAIARDILATGMVRAHRAGFNLVMHVHDELVALTKLGEDRLQNLIDLMAEAVRWAPGLPLGAAGYIGRIYRKD